MRRPRIRIDTNALLHNFNQVKQFAPNSKVLAVVKADAYGHGAAEVAHTLKDADAFAVIVLPEAQILRKAGVTKPVVLLHGVENQADFRQCSILNCQPVIHCETQLEALESACLTLPIHVWLKVDTGMHRLGFQAHEFEDAYARLQAISKVKSIVVMSHFACADDPEHVLNAEQVDCFEGLTGHLNVERAMCNSAALVSFPQAQYEWVRPGIMLYGASPFGLNRTTEQLGLKAVMSLNAPIISVKTISEGETIGYGATYICKQEMTIAAVAIGYGDGYPRRIRNGKVAISGSYAKILGRVSMDTLVVDVTGLNVSVGDEAEIWGQNLPLDEVAAAADTIGYELTCSVSNQIIHYER